MTKSVVKLFNELAESLTQAEGATSQLIHQSGHPVQFIQIRDTLALMKEGCLKVAPHNVLLAPKTVYLKSRKGK